MTLSAQDDLPWPELGNVSRGATRGNQGQKGVLGSPDRDGRCQLQLRVQPGVLAVRLNRQASEWYRTLDNEVNRALKLTKTYWRKARRRQDYDARADQDHMELHEWLQQLKDKTMSHLELLMQKGDIQGPPYVMPDDVELSFLRGFIERHKAGIPHNPRLRNGERPTQIRASSVDSMSPEPESAYVPPPQKYRSSGQVSVECASEASSSHVPHSSPRGSKSPSLLGVDTLTQEASTSSTYMSISRLFDVHMFINCPSRTSLQAARASLTRSSKDTQDAFLRYTACLDVERQARQAVVSAEKRRDDISMSVDAALLIRSHVFLAVAALLVRTQQQGHHSTSRSRHLSASDDEDGRSPPRYIKVDTVIRRFNDLTAAPVSWPESDPQQNAYANEAAYVEVSPQPHSVVLIANPFDYFQDPSAKASHGQYACEVSQPPFDGFETAFDISIKDIAALPPRKRVHHMMPGFEVLSNVAALQAANMPMPS
ncbi:NAD-aldehyde dehydrogenase [Salix suchowensis]|nr:NAD-aldehyde dehydrogenase [Salix suchowensis]